MTQAYVVPKPSLVTLAHVAYALHAVSLAIGFAFSWVLVIAVISFPLAIVLIGIRTWFLGMFLLGIWAVIRIARGWLRLRNGQPIDY